MSPLYMQGVQDAENRCINPVKESNNEDYSQGVMHVVEARCPFVKNPRYQHLVAERRDKGMGGVSSIG